MASEAMKAAQRKASSPEARAKAVATMKRKREEREAGLLAHAKITKKKGRPKKVQSIPLDMIPDAPKKGRPKKGGPAKSSASRQEVVLALLKYLNGE